MKAVIITSYGGPEVLEIQERRIPDILPNEVLIQVKAAGVNRRALKKSHFKMV